MLINHDFPSDFPQLTKRQAQVLNCLGDHMTTKEIARALNISPSMVDQHLRVISHKLGGLPRRELARLRAEITAQAPPPREGALLVTAPGPSPQSPAQVLTPGWRGSFIVGFLTGLVSGLLVALVTLASLTVLLAPR